MVCVVFTGSELSSYTSEADYTGTEERRESDKDWIPILISTQYQVLQKMPFFLLFLNDTSL